MTARDPAADPASAPTSQRRTKGIDERVPLTPIRYAQTGTLNVGYYETGPQVGAPILLLHGYPYDIHSYVDVIPLLAARGLRVIVPYLRGHGPTRFLHDRVSRSGQQAALGVDVVELLDALGIERAVLAGYDWGGRAACIAAALWPDRCTALVSVNSYLIQDIAASNVPLPADIEAGLWYFFYFLTERGRAGLTTNRTEIARVIWTRNSPDWAFSDAQLVRASAAFHNPDYVDVVLHSYRHRLGDASGSPEYEDVERQLARQPTISVPTVTLDGLADGNFPAHDATAAASHFTGPREHHQVPHAGHNLPQEAPQAFAEAVIEAIQLRDDSSLVGQAPIRATGGGEGAASR